MNAALAALVFITRLSLPPTLTSLESPEGAARLERATAKADFVPLALHYEAQAEGSYCGVASTVMVLNALDVAAPVVDKWAPARAFTQQNVFNADARRLGVDRGGLTLQMLAALFRTEAVTVTATHAADATVDVFRAAVAANLARPGDFIVVNYLRSAVGQEPDDLIGKKLAGHISPLGAYDATGDSVLIMDVNRWRYPAVWVPLPALFAAMNTIDIDSGKTRGWLEVARAAKASPPSSLPRAGNRLLLFAAAIVSVIFALGALLGFFIGRRRRR